MFALMLYTPIDPVVACLTAVREGPTLNVTIATAIYSLGHGLRTFTAVHRSTRSVILRGTVK